MNGEDDLPDNVVSLPQPGPAVEVTSAGWEGEELHDAVEALLFAAGEPVSISELADALELTDHEAVRDALHAVAQAGVGRGLRVVKVAGGWQLRTDARFADAILRLRGARPQTMSQAALEALAIVAYRQPVTRSEVDELRGVGSGGVLKSLLDKGYLRVVGRRDEPGRPLEYGTTPVFLEMFELAGLDQLPTLAEREELAETEEEDVRVEVPESVLEPEGEPGEPAEE